MSLDMQSIREYANLNNGQFVYDRTEDSKTRVLQEASFLHKVKSFFGFSSVKRVNDNTVDAIRRVLINDSQFYAVSDKVNELMGNLKGGITAKKLRSILTTLDRCVTSMSGDKFTAKAQDTILGQLAAKGDEGVPSFLKDNGLDKRNFMAWYNKTAAAHVVSKLKDGILTGGAQNAIKQGIGEFHERFRSYIDVFKNYRSKTTPAQLVQIKTFARMCSTGKILVITPDGALDHKKTLENVRQLKAQFDMADTAGAENKMMKSVLLDNAINHPGKFSADMMDQAIELHKDIQMEELKGLTSKSSKEEIRTALKNTLEECKSNIDRKVDVSTISSDLSGPDDLARLYRRVRMLAVQCAVASLPEKNRTDLVELLQGNGARDLWKDLKTSDDSDLKSLCNALTDALKTIYVEKEQKILPDNANAV